MGCKMNLANISVFSNIPTRTPTIIPANLSFQAKTNLSFIASSYTQKAQEIGTKAAPTQVQEQEHASCVEFQALSNGKLGISWYPDFEYNARGGKGTGIGRRREGEQANIISVVFDVQSLYVPPLTSATTKFMGLPLPPFLKIEVVPKVFEGGIEEETGKVELEFTADFCFSIGSIYRAPPLLVKTVLTSEESRGVVKRGRGERLDGDGNCRLVGVATVDPIDDMFMNSFLSLPTECLADLNAKISLSESVDLIWKDDSAQND